MLYIIYFVNDRFLYNFLISKSIIIKSLKIFHVWLLFASRYFAYFCIMYFIFIFRAAFIWTLTSGVNLTSKTHCFFPLKIKEKSLLNWFRACWNTKFPQTSTTSYPNPNTLTCIYKPQIKVKVATRTHLRISYLSPPS